MKNRSTPFLAGFALCLTLIATVGAVNIIESLKLSSDADAAGFQINNLGTATNSTQAASLGVVTNRIALASTNYATTAQGAKADSAVQPAGNNTFTGSNSFNGTLAILGNPVTASGRSVVTAPANRGIIGREVPALRRLTERLRAGYSDTLGLMGDSTSSSSDKWFYQTLQRFATEFPNTRIVERLNTSGTGTSWVETVIQAGSGEQYAENVGDDGRGVALGLSPITFTGDLDFRFKVSFNSWPRVMVSGLLGVAYVTNSDATFWFELFVNTNWAVLEVWDQGGTKRTYNITGVLTEANFPTPGTPYWLRITLDIDNGAGGSTATLYKSTSTASEGATWTQVGSAATIGTVLTGYQPCTQYVQVLGRQTASELKGVKLYRAELRSGGIGDSRPVQNPQVPHTWAYNYSNPDQVKPVANPTLYVINVSTPGAGLRGFLDNQNFDLLLPNFGQSAQLTSFGYNDLNALSAWTTDLAAFRTHLLSRHPVCAYVPVSQPPERVAATTYWDTSDRAMLAAQWGQNIADGYIPANEAFRAAVAAGTPLNDLVSADTRHPTAAGYLLWRDTALRSFGIAP